MSQSPQRVAMTALVGVLTMVSVAISGLADPPLSAGASAPAFPQTIHADNGAITIGHRPSAIVSLSATATEMLYAIGAGRQVKAVDSYSDYPRNAPHTSLNGTTPNVEAIVAYKPDLVVVAGDTTGLTGQLAKFGIPVLSEPPAATLAQAYQQYTQLGAATGHRAQSQAEMHKIKNQLAQIVRTTPRPPRGETYYFELEQDYYSVTSSTFIGQVLRLFGLRSIADSATGAASSGGYPQLSEEFILNANPTFIFLADTVCCGQTPSTVKARPGWSVMSAVKKSRIVPLNDDIASRWGPRIVTLVRQVASALKAGR